MSHRICCKIHKESSNGPRKRSHWRLWVLSRPNIWWHHSPFSRDDWDGNTSPSLNVHGRDFGGSRGVKRTKTYLGGLLPLRKKSFLRIWRYFPPRWYISRFGLNISWRTPIAPINIPPWRLSFSASIDVCYCQLLPIPVSVVNPPVWCIVGVYPCSVSL